MLCYKFGANYRLLERIVSVFMSSQGSYMALQVATEKSPSPPVPATQLSPDSRCCWKYFSRPNKATNPRTHTLPKIQPNPYSAACKEPCQSLATSGLEVHAIQDSALRALHTYSTQLMQFEHNSSLIGC